jgi:predicted dinucleotide-binding enzyme
MLHPQEEESRVVKQNSRHGEKELRLGIVGFGRVGRACADVVLEAKDLTVAAIVRRLDRVAQPLPEVFSQVPVVSHTAQVPGMDGVLLCVPTAQVFEAAHDCLPTRRTRRRIVDPARGGVSSAPRGDRPARRSV